VEDQFKFEEFPKLYRLRRPVVVTEKIDGTNAQVAFDDAGKMYVGSRNRWITPDNDNMGFARWCAGNEEELRKLGPGRHYGEWWGRGIQRTYGVAEKRFSLFNVQRWADAAVRPKCCELVPVLYVGEFSHRGIEGALEQLRAEGSVAAPGFMNPEGVVVFHVQSQHGYKITLGDDGHKGTATPK
jgi:hypothetical protein